MKNDNKILWVIVGIAVGLVIAMSGMLVYNKYVDNKEDINNKTEENENNNQENIDLTGYTEIDISKSNIYPIYMRNENDSYLFELSNNLQYEGKFVIENTKLYFKINNEKFLINIENPKKVVIGEYGQDSTFTLFILTTKGEIYAMDCITYYGHIYPEPSDISVTTIINEFVKHMNNNIKRYYDFIKISNISSINQYGNSESWEDVYFTYTKDNQEMIILSHQIYELEYYPAKNIKEFTLDLGPVSVKADKTVFDVYGNKVNIKPKYLLEYISETGHGAFLDEDNYLYVSTYSENENMKKGKVLKAYSKDNFEIVVKFEDGTYKNLSEYHDW